MGTEIYGGIEYRHPHAGADWYEGDTWLTAMSIRPLYDQNDYASFACLFGVRNYAGFSSPLAAGRGLPDDLSAGFRAELELLVAAGHLDQASWVSWAELASLDPSVSPEHYTGRLIWSAKSSPWVSHQQLVPAEWPAGVREKVGPPPTGWDAATERMDWETADLIVRYQSLSMGAILGSDSHWPFVFAVMGALAIRFGDHGVRLVVAFD